jgi:Arc/MetJ family transcription regulator
MKRRTTIEIDEDLLLKAQDALDLRTIRGTVEEALRRAAAQHDDDHSARVHRQRRFLERLPILVDLDELAARRMWR